MWTLIKGSFWFSLVLVLLPVFHSGSSERLANAPPVSFTDAFGMASGAYAYLTNMCAEKPDVCEKGGKTFTALGYRAREGALIAYEYLNSKFSDEPAALAAAKAPAAAQPAASAGQASDALAAAKAVASLADAALAPAEGDADAALAGDAAWQPMPRKPQPYRPPVADKVVTGTVPSAASADAMPAAFPAHVPVPLPRPYPEG